MGAWASRRNHGVEEVDISTNNAYRYPPKSGCYFGSHFIMGGDRFETTQPEAYLFGDNQDLNFLGNRPVPFPYPAPQAHEPTKTLKSLVNIRKDSLRFIRVNEDDAVSSTSADRRVSRSESNVVQSTPSTPDRESITISEHPEEVDVHKPSSTPQPTAPVSTSEDHPTAYNVEFTFDSDVKCAITIMYFATEEISNKQAIYRPRDPSMNSETFHFKRGANQVFCQATHVIDPSNFPEEEWQFNPDKEIIPVVIQCVVEEEEYVGHSHMTFATVEKVEQGYSLKPLKQKQMVDGLCYLLQEIYGIENKNAEAPKDDDFEENGSECVICLVETRDTLILPCRHLCLCNCCADNLRYQASNCPICRSPFRALLQIRAMRKKMIPLSSQISAADHTNESPSQEGLPPGYESVSLIEALNGPSTPIINHALSRSRRNYPDAAGRVGSQPASPEESPLVGRRKLRRKTSSSSNRSRHSIRSATFEGTRELDRANDTERRNTPEVIMTEITDASKSPKVKKFNMPKIRYPSAKTALNEPFYEVVNENAPAKDTADNMYEELQVDIVDETAKEAVAEVAICSDSETQTETSRPGSAQSSECSPRDSYPKDAPDADVCFKPAARKMVLCDTEPSSTDVDFTEEVISQDGPSMFSGSSHGGGPDASGSSYSSTDSSKDLLDQRVEDLEDKEQDPEEDEAAIA